MRRLAHKNRMSDLGRWVLAAALVLFGLLPGRAALAGNVVLTGHDDDFHERGEGPAGAPGVQLNAMIGFARAGSALPVLVFDNGSLELANALTDLGIPHTVVNPSVAANITASLFDVTKFSAIAVASNQSCGGCDLSNTDVNNLGAHKTDFAAFVTAGGGLVGLTAASGPSFPYVPNAAGAFGSPPSFGYFQTPDGAAFGIPAVNGDPTHNFFLEPGAGTDPAYKVLERLSDPGRPDNNNAETIGILGASIICTGPECIITVPTTPEPGTLLLLGTGLVGVVAALRRRI